MSTVVVLGSAGQLRPLRPLRVRSDPFTLGVASGDPHSDSVMLWTCLAPRPLEPGGGVASRSVDVDWQVSDAPSMRRIVASGRVRTRPDHAHAVHVAARGLEPAGDYWYRFRCGSWLSPIGRTRTAPARDQRVDQLSWATASCQAWEDGHYTAHRHLAAEEVDVVFFLGDYIYERTIGPSVRGPVERFGEGLADGATTLERYRLRYGLYKSDPDLQAAHHAAPWIVTCDDHEVEDGYAGSQPGSGPVDGFARRRHAAYQAFWEHQPVRGGPPRGPSLRLHRRATYGDLATFHVLDTRQHRSTGRVDGSATMLGRDQERWLEAGIDRSTTTLEHRRPAGARRNARLLRRGRRRGQCRCVGRVPDGAAAPPRRPCSEQESGRAVGRCPRRIRARHRSPRLAGRASPWSWPPPRSAAGVTAPRCCRRAGRCGRPTPTCTTPTSVAGTCGACSLLTR